MPTAPTVTVVIPTYCSGPRLDEAILSIDRQSLPQEQIEVLLLDDGSPDDTAARIEAIAASRPNYRAFALEASGWPSRPRNVGVREARGRYVLFMDHDDILFSAALEAAAKLGDEAQADVVNGKEVRTDNPDWAFASFARDLSDAGDQHLRGLLPMTPHKLYRRDFLIEHDVRFPEVPRHLWEDVFFHIDLLRHRPRVAVLASQPFYHWRVGPAGTSSASDGSRIEYGGDPEYWFYLDKLFARISTIEDRDLRDDLLVHNVRVRVTTRLRRPGDPSYEIDHQGVDHILKTYVPTEVDALMPPRTRVVVELCRAGRADEAGDLLRAIAVQRPVVTATSIAAVDKRAATVEGTVVWSAEDGEPFARRSDGGDIARCYPEAVVPALASVGIPATPDTTSVEFTFLVRNQEHRTSWAIPAQVEVALVEQPDGSCRPEGTFRVDLERKTAAAGRPLRFGDYQCFAVVRFEERSATVNVASALEPGLDVGAVSASHTPAGNLLVTLPQAKPRG